MIGYIDSIESMGLVDGPGIRMVVFMKGCKLRCLFCHNPETWKLDKKNPISSNEILEKVLRNISYYKNGGITFSGGEPLLQPDFLIDCLKKCKSNNIHTAIDTAGVGIGKYEEILKYTDLVILDIKAYESNMYKKITSYDIFEFNKFIDVLKKLNKKLWIRNVIVPGINDNEDYIKGLKNYLKQFDNIEKIELLPYHLYGVDKYKKLNIDYPLKCVSAMDNSKLKKLQDLL